MSARPKLALLHYSATPVIGGVESVMAQHATLLRDAGYDVRVLAGRGDATLIPEMDSCHPDVLRTMAAIDAGGDGGPQFERLRARIVQGLRDALRDRDLIIAHNVLTLPLNLPLVAALRDVGRPIISWTHDLLWSEPDLARFVREDWPCNLFRGALPGVAYVTVSETRRRELAAALGMPTDDIAVVPNGIDVLAFSQISGHVRALLSAADALDADPLILVPQRVTHHKGMDVVIECAASLVERWPRLRIVVTGPPDPHIPAAERHAQRILALRAERGLERAVRFLFELSRPGEPHRVSATDVADLYRVSDLVLLPSETAGFGLPLLEAALARAPVVCTDLPAFQEVARDGAELIRPNASGREVAAAVERGLAQPAARQRRSIVRRYSWPRILETIERTIARAMEG